MKSSVAHIWDISPRIHIGIPVWPGDTAYQEGITWEMTNNCPVKVSRFTMSTHTGSHCDAPSHYDANGISIAEVNLGTYIGPCRVIHCLGVSHVLPEHLSGHLTNLPPRVLFRTYLQAPQTTWDHDFPSVHPDTIELLAQHHVQLIGIDSPSLDPQESKTMDCHLRVKQYGLAIIEGIILDEVEEADYELIALPLKLVGMDASPVRAILRSL